MYDKLELHIPFKYDHCLVDHRGYGELDMLQLGIMGLNVIAMDVDYCIDPNGPHKLRKLRHVWEKLPSSFTDIAMKIRNGNAEANILWPSLIVQASPAKVAQGHNIFGFTDLRLCAEHILAPIFDGQPELAEMLDFGNAQVKQLDCTYSIRLNSRQQIEQALEAIKNTSGRYIRPSRGNYDTTAYFGCKSKDDERGKYRSGLVYAKDDEVIKQLSEVRAEYRQSPRPQLKRIIDTLSDFSLMQFASNRLRFEARIKGKALERSGIPTNLWQLISYSEAYEAVNGHSLCEHLWSDYFSGILSSIGDTQIESTEKHLVHSRLKAMYSKTTYKDKIVKGMTVTTKKVNHSKANRLFNLYDTIYEKGYAHAKDNVGISSSKFYRDLTDLLAIGISRSQLQNLKDDKDMINLSELLTFDFDNQRPAGYKEPESPFSKLKAKERSYLAGIFELSERYHSELSNFSPETLAEDSGYTVDMVHDLISGHSIPVSPRKSISLVFWPDGRVNFDVHDTPLGLISEALKRAPDIPVYVKQQYYDNTHNPILNQTYIN